MKLLILSILLLLSVNITAKENVVSPLFEHPELVELLGENFAYTVSKYHDILLTKSPSEAVKIAETYLQVAEQMELEKAADLYSHFGSIYRDRGMYDIALNFYYRALSVSIKNQAFAGVAYSLNDIGNIYYDQQKFEKALSIYKKALDISTRIAEPKVLAVTLNNLGISYREQGLYQKSYNHFYKGLQIRKKLNNEYLIAHSYRYLGNISRLMKDYEIGLKYYEEALKIFKYLDQQKDVASVYNLKGILYSDLNDNLKAEEFYLKSLGLSKKLNDPALLTTIYYDLAEFHFKNSEFKKALKFSDSSIELAKEYNFLQYQAKNYLLKYNIYEKSGQYKLALNHMLNYEQLKDLMFTKVSESKIANLQVLHELEKKGNQLRLIRKENQLKQKALETAEVRNDFMIIWVLFFIFFAVIVLVLYIQKSSKNKLLKQKNLVIEQQKERIEENNQQLILANEKTAHSLKVKSDFLSNMSHEIRTPMNAILGFTNLLLEEEKDFEKENQLKSIKYSAENLLIIINDILDYSNIESGKIKLEQISFDLYELVEQLIKSNNIQKGKEIELRAEINPEVPRFILGDPTRLYQILMNLVSNAVKFTDYGSVTLNISSLKNEDDKVELLFEVIDTGIGIEEDRLNLLFERFSQAGSDIKRRFGGTGLGLAICKQLIALFGGEIGVKSRNGEGSTFYFKIKFTKESRIISMPLKSMISEKDRALLKEIKVLYVEDNDINQYIAIKIAEKNGFQIDIAPGGHQALQMLLEKNFDIILMDVQMPDIDGFETTSIIRDPASEYYNPSIPIIGLTADVFDETRFKAFETGMDDLLTKPVDQKDLINRILYYYNNMELLSRV